MAQKKALQKGMRFGIKSGITGKQKKGGDAVMLVSSKPKERVCILVDETLRSKINELAEVAQVSFSKAAQYVLQQHIDAELLAAKKAGKR